LASPWPVPESHRGELFTAKSRQVIQRKRAQQDSEPFATRERESRRFPRTAGRSFLATRGSGRAGLGPATSWFASSRRHAISLILRDSGSDLDGLFPGVREPIVHALHLHSRAGLMMSGRSCATA